jgi:tRNA(adenine34) deaminase
VTTGYLAAFEPAMREALAAAQEAARDGAAEAAEAGQATANGTHNRRADVGDAAASAGAGLTKAGTVGAGDPGVSEAAADVPVGAVILDRAGTVLARAHNEREANADPTAHAEIVAIRAAAKAAGTWRLDGCTLVVTLEPCTMCAGAVTAARLARLVYGAEDPKGGAAGSLWDVLRDSRLAHRTEVIGGVLAEECGALLRAFFADRRNRAG